MDDMISRAALREFLVRAGRFLKAQDDKRSAAHVVGKIIEHIDNMPAVDAVPVVFCKDCEYCHPLYCTIDGSPAGDGSFSCGESDMDYYAPSYHMDTYYCADGKRRVPDDTRH